MVVFQGRLTNAYNHVPRREREACANVFDAMEAVAKTVYQKPTDTFGRVIGHIRRNNLLNSVSFEP
jgi:hypothetical protein